LPPAVAAARLVKMPLQELVERDGAQAAGRSVRILARIATALAAAHAAGVLHGDIKPSNAMLKCADDTVKVIDFGLTASHRAARETAASPTIMGTPAYMAPEVLAGQRCDERSEVYALGLRRSSARTRPT
jgi:eukaryotic-like serine/threonine-protein kinase